MKFRKRFRRFQIGLFSCRSEVSLKDILIDVNEKHDKFLEIPVVEEPTKLRELHGSFTHLAISAKTTNTIAIDYERLCTKMLNVGFAVVHCKTLPIKSIEDVSKNSVLLNLIE